MTREQMEHLWQDKRNWRLGIIYCCPEDPRTIVPRRWRWGGWTLNFCHPKAGYVGLAAFLLAVGPGLLAHLLLNNPHVTLVVMLISIVALMIWAHMESSRTL